MNYFTEVYLPRMNKHGTNMQERIHGRMACDFERKLEKSVNKVNMYKDGAYISQGILETNQISETEVIDYLLTRVKDKYDNGFVFQTIKPFSNNEKQSWLVLTKEQYETIGYNRYVVVLLENKLEWIGNDGLLHSSWVHYVGSQEGKIKQNFKMDYEVAVATPGKTLTMICPYNESLKRNLKLNISDETWSISGIDKISVPGVMYVTLEEDYTQKTTYANEDSIEGWSIMSAQGDELVFTLGQEEGIDLYCAYNGVMVNEKIELSCNDKKVKITTKSFNKFKFNGEAGTYTVTARLANNKLVEHNFSLTISDKKEDWIAIVGPEQLKVLQTLEYKLNTSLQSYEANIESQNGCFVIDHIEDNKVYLKGTNIGQDYILITYKGITYSTPINVISPWM